MKVKPEETGFTKPPLPSILPREERPSTPPTITDPIKNTGRGIEKNRNQRPRTRQGVPPKTPQRIIVSIKRWLHTYNSPAFTGDTPPTQTQTDPENKRNYRAEKKAKWADLTPTTPPSFTPVPTPTQTQTDPENKRNYRAEKKAKWADLTPTTPPSFTPVPTPTEDMANGLKKIDRTLCAITCLFIFGEGFLACLDISEDHEKEQIGGLIAIGVIESLLMSLQLILQHQIRKIQIKVISNSVTSIAPIARQRAEFIITQPATRHCTEEYLPVREALQRSITKEEGKDAPSSGYDVFKKNSTTQNYGDEIKKELLKTSKRPCFFISTIAIMLVTCIIMNFLSLEDLNQHNSTTSNDSEDIHKNPAFFLQLVAAIFKISWEISDLIGIKHFPLPEKLEEKITNYQTSL